VAFGCRNPLSLLGLFGGKNQKKINEFSFLQSKKRKTVSSRARPTDKSLVVINEIVAAGQITTDLVTATFPCTATGIRWDLSACAAGATVTGIYWAIVIVRDGDSVKTIATSDGSTFYAPEQNVIAYGVGVCDGNRGDQVDWSGHTKSMRKLMGGDKLVFVSIGDAANNNNLRGCIQFFCKA